MTRRKHFTHQMWHYTGNSPSGQDHVYQDGRAELLTALGLTRPDWNRIDVDALSDEDYQALLRKDQQCEDAYFALYNADEGEGAVTIAGRKIVVTLSRVMSRDSFGYETKTVYSMVD